MDDKLIVCPMCGHAYDPSTNGACDTCPLNKGCQMVCCPACGYTDVNTRESGIVRLIQKLRGEKQHAHVME